MDNLLKQMRVRFSGLLQGQEEAYNTQEGRIPPQKTVSFKGERKKANSWFQRQFSDRMSKEDDAAELELRTAIAAAAYAIMLAEEEGILAQKKPTDEYGRSPTQARGSGKDSMSRFMGKSKTSRWFSAKEADEDGIVADESFKRKSSTLGERLKEEPAADLKTQDKAMSSTPIIEKTPTFSDKHQNDAGNKPFDLGQSAPHTMKPKPSFSSNGFRNGNRMQYSTNGQNKAHAWEQATLEKIRKRHEKMNNTILQWENEKKVKAKRRIERKERELETRRARILQEYNDEMIRIGMIASGARAVAKDTRRSNELKAKEKAKKMQSTKKAHHKCLCF